MGVLLKFAGFLWMSASLMTACSAQIAPLELKPPKSPAMFQRNFFGMHVHNPGAVRNWPDIPIGSLRLWDARIGWNYLESRPGIWDFARLDEMVAWAESRSVEILLPLWVSPRWASARPDEKGAYGPGAAAEPADIEAWRNYVRMVATRYRGRIAAYQIGNESNIRNFYSGDINTLVQMVNVAREEIRKQDKSVLIVAPSGVGLDQRIAWPSQILAAGMAQDVNIAAFHLYHEGGPPEGMIMPLQKMLALNVAAGFAAVPMWNTESGLLVAHSAVKWPEGLEKKAISADLVAEYLPRDLLLARVLGFERYFAYAWDNKMYGFIDPVHGKHRPAADVLAQFIVTLMRSTLHACSRSAAGQWTCELTAANGARIQAIWLDPAAARKSLRVATPFAGRLKPLDGKSDWQALEASAEIEIGPVVTLLEQAR